MKHNAYNFQGSWERLYSGVCTAEDEPAKERSFIINIIIFLNNNTIFTLYFIVHHLYYIIAALLLINKEEEKKVAVCLPKLQQLWKMLKKKNGKGRREG